MLFCSFGSAKSWNASLVFFWLRPVGWSPCDTGECQQSSLCFVVCDCFARSLGGDGCWAEIGSENVFDPRKLCSFLGLCLPGLGSVFIEWTSMEASTFLAVRETTTPSSVIPECFLRSRFFVSLSFSFRTLPRVVCLLLSCCISLSRCVSVSLCFLQCVCVCVSLFLALSLFPPLPASLPLQFFFAGLKILSPPKFLPMTAVIKSKCLTLSALRVWKTDHLLRGDRSI